MKSEPASRQMQEAGVRATSGLFARELASSAQIELEDAYVAPLQADQLEEETQLQNIHRGSGGRVPHDFDVHSVTGSNEILVKHVETSEEGLILRVTLAPDFEADPYADDRLQLLGLGDGRATINFDAETGILRIASSMLTELEEQGSQVLDLVFELPNGRLVHVPTEVSSTEALIEQQQAPPTGRQEDPPTEQQDAPPVDHGETTTIPSGSGNDRQDGGSGDDVRLGGEGRDRLSGGGGEMFW